jgi:hypothetical protein
LLLVVQVAVLTEAAAVAQGVFYLAQDYCLTLTLYMPLLWGRGVLAVQVAQAHLLQQETGQILCFFLILLLVAAAVEQRH